MKREAPNHPKMLRLCTALGCRKFVAVGILELLWHLTARYCPRGDVGRFGDAEIAAALDWDESPEDLLASLIRAGWLDEDSEHRLIVHGWAEHADQAVRRKLQRNGLSFLVADMTSHRLAMSSIPVPEPVPEPEPEPEPEPSGANAPASVSDSLRTAWNQGLRAAEPYRPQGATPWVLTDTFRRNLNALLRDHPELGNASFCYIVHGYRYARRGWPKVEDHFHPKTLLRPANREEYLSAYFDATHQGLEPPFLAEPASDSRTAQTRRVAQSIEEQIENAGPQRTP